MKKYRDLNLKKIRIDNNLDFAHFTYKDGMCSCCYGPRDLPKRYWKDGKIPEQGDSFQYILFKNANNGSGQVTKNFTIDDYTCISNRIYSRETLKKVCLDLMSQLDDDYFILMPKTDSYCIVIRTYDGYKFQYDTGAEFKLTYNDEKNFDLITYSDVIS